MKKMTLLLLLFSFTAKAQLQLISGGTITTLVNAGGSTYTQAITLTANATLKTLDDKAYIISGNITGAFSLTAELFADSKLTLSGANTYSGFTGVTGGELILTNTSVFRSFNLNIPAGATLTIDASAYGSQGEVYHVFGSNFNSNFTVTGAGQVNFKGVKNKNYGIYSSTDNSSTNKSMLFNMEANGQLNIDGGNWTMGVSAMEIFANNLGNLNVAADTKFTIYGRTVQFDKITGSGEIHSPANATNDMTIKIGIGNGACDWGGKFSEADILRNKKINIEKVGTGTISFTGSNWQTGTTTITAGALSISDGDYRGDIINNATLILKQGDYFRYSNSISGRGNVVKRGNEGAVLAGGTIGIVGHTGSTIIESGELTLEGCKEIKNSQIIVQNGATLTIPDYNYIGPNYAEITSSGNLSLAANSAVRIKFRNSPSKILAVPSISAPNGFLIKFSGYAGPYTGNNITLIKCTGTLPTILPTLIENSVDYGNDSRKCATLSWVNGTGLVATFAETGPAINPPSPTLCIGGTQRFTISSGGTPATPAWTSSNPNIVSISTDGLATTLRNGKSVVTYSNTAGCILSSVLTVNGHVIRPEDTNPTFCVGAGIRLKAYDSPTGGTSSLYNPAWTSDHPLIATVADNGIDQGQPVGYATLLTPGIATIKFKDKDDCIAEYAIDVKGLATANAGEDKEICAGNSVTIGATAQTGVTYSWSPTTGLSASNVANPTASPTATTTYTLIARTASSNASPTATTAYTLTARTASSTTSQCPTATDQVEVKVNPLPGITSAQGRSSQIRPTATISLSASTNGTANSWSSSNATVTLATGTDAKSATATGVAVGNANITYTDVKGCIGTHPITVSTSGKTNQTITFTPIAEKNIGDADFTLSATTTSGLPITFSTTSDKVTISGNSVKIEKAGKASIQANQTGNNTINPATQMSNIFCIMPAKPTISINNRTLTSSADNGNQWSLNGNTIAGATGKTYTATADGNYTVKVTIEDCASVLSDPVSISTPNKTSQTITFTTITEKTVGDVDFTLSATTTSELPITFTATSDKVTISGNSVKIEKAGKARIQAYQAGNNTFNPATRMSNIFCIMPAKPSISINNRILTSSAGNGNQWYLNGNTIAGATGQTYTATADGNYTLKVTIEECVSAFSDPVSVSSPNKTPQTIIFTTITDKTIGDADFTLSATPTSGLPITFSTTSDKVTITENKVKIVKVGKASIQANQAGSDTYNPATQMSNIFCIMPAKPTITYTESNKTLSSLADNGNQWYLNGNTIAGATGQTYTATTNGSYTLKVTIEECTSAFSDPVRISTIPKISQTITLTAIADKTIGDANFTLSAATTSGLSITFSTTSDKVSITENKVKIEKAGKASIQANQTGDDTYHPATQMSNTFCINPAKPTITYTESNKTLTSLADNGNQWSLNGKAIDGATGKTYTATANGNYTLKVTIEDCASVLSEPTAVAMVTGDIPNDELQIFPNPVHDQLVIELPSHENGLISLFSVAGQNLHSTSAAGKAIINMKDFPAGIYILKIQTAGKMMVRKVARN